MTEWVREWGGLLSTVALLAVTGWYAALTRRLAVSAEQSADSAALAAEAARATVAATVANVNVNFEVTPFFFAESRRPWMRPENGGLGVQVRCTGATVFVHGLRLDKLGVFFPPGAGRSGVGITFGGQPSGVSFEPKDRMPFPRRLHRGEALSLIPAVEVIDLAPDDVAAIRATTYYTFSGVEEPIDRRVEWIDEPTGEVETGDLN